MAIQCHIDRISAGGVAGWAWDPAAAERAIEVELHYEGERLGLLSAGQYRPDLERAGYRGGRCAFEFKLPPGRPLEAPERVRLVFRDPARPEVVRELPGRRTHDDGELDFGANPLPVLQPLGLELSTLRHRRTFDPASWLEPPVVVHAQLARGTRFEIGAFTGIFGGTLERCRIGRYCSIAPDVVIGPNEHPIDWLTTSVIAEQPRAHGWDRFVDPARADGWRAHVMSFERNHRLTTIGNDVWIGNGAFVRTGVTIGDGAVIGARSVVVSDIPPYAVAVGNPARVKRLRFAEPIIARLHRLQWWRFCLYDLIGLPLHHIEAALDGVEARVAAGTLAEWRPERFTLPRLRAALAAGRKAPPA